MVQQGVAPIESGGLIVHGEAVGPTEQHVAEHLHSCSVHVCSADIRRTVPFAVEHVTTVGVDHNGTRSLQVLQQGSSIVVVPRGQDVGSI